MDRERLPYVTNYGCILEKNLKDSEFEDLQQSGLYTFCDFIYPDFCSITLATDKNTYIKLFHLCVSIKILLPKSLFRKLIYSIEVAVLYVFLRN